MLRKQAEDVARLSDKHESSDEQNDSLSDESINSYGEITLQAGGPITTTFDENVNQINKLIDISQESWEKSEFYELDNTLELISNHKFA
jgi:hypothetical protein